MSEYQTTSDTLRNGDLQSLVTLLRDRDARKVDVIAPASKIRSEGGVIVVADASTEITEDGVTVREARLTPGNVFNEGIADKLKIPLAYVRRIHAERPDLYDANVNGWLQGPEGNSPDARNFLVRSFTSPTPEAETGFARAFLSDTFKIVDDFDALTAALDGVRKAGVAVEITKCDLTERRMYVKVAAEGIKAYAPTLLAGYRSPFTGQTGSENPTVFAGFVVSNSEVGGGAFSITPQITVQVCSNGMTITKDATRAVHLGSRNDEGIIRWSEDTQRKTLELITLKAADAVKTFLDVDYVTGVVKALEAQSGKPIEGKLDEQVRLVAKKCLFTEEVTEGVLDHFIRGGQFTAGGVLHAVTSFAQTLDDADAAYALEESGVKALEFAAAL